MGMLFASVLGFIFFGACCIGSVLMIKQKDCLTGYFVFIFTACLFFTVMSGYGIYDSIKQKTWTPEYKVKELKREISEKEKQIRKLEAEITFRENEE